MSRNAALRRFAMLAWFGVFVAVPAWSAPGHHVTLNWKASVSPVKGYLVYRATSPKGPYTRITSDPVTATTYTDNSVAEGVTYFYQVTAISNKGAESVPTAQTKATVP